MMKLKGFYLLCGILVFVSSSTFQSCGNGEEDPNDSTVVSNSYISTIENPKSGSYFVQGDKIPFKITFSDNGKSVIKTDIFLDGKNIFSSKKNEKEINHELMTDSVALGPHSISVEVSINTGTVESYPIEIMVLSKSVPESYGYKVINKYPHDVHAYTQGLVYENGYMYEGTGQYGESELRLVDYKQNKVIQSQKLDKSIFGEGITILGNKIYQLSWQNKKCLVYDKSTFKLLTEFSYPTEGWGLTTDGTDLILSDGTPIIYFYDPQTFALKRKIVVVDNVTAIGVLNELEFINGEIWANVYQTNLILRINPKTGQVNSKIDLIGLLTDKELGEKVDVLNGIAYDAANDKIFVTGKLWPWLFEIDLIKNQPK